LGVEATIQGDPTTAEAVLARLDLKPRWSTARYDDAAMSRVRGGQQLAF
jgi:hypothetical protein